MSTSKSALYPYCAPISVHSPSNWCGLLRSIARQTWCLSPVMSFVNISSNWRLFGTWGGKVVPFPPRTEWQLTCIFYFLHENLDWRWFGQHWNFLLERSGNGLWRLLGQVLVAATHFLDTQRRSAVVPVFQRTETLILFCFISWTWASPCERHNTPLSNNIFLDIPHNQLHVL